MDHVGFGQAEGRRARRANVADKQMGPKLPHPSVSLVLPLPPPTTTTTTTTTKFGGIESADDAANKNASSSAFADGELRAGTHFNALLWDPVACARFLDDRPWGCVEAFARGVVDGSRCISHLCVGGRAGADNVHIDPAGVCTGKGVLDGDRLERHPLSKPGKALRHNYKVNLAYYGPAGTGQTNNQIIQLKG